jgi:hypothetical protein
MFFFFLLLLLISTPAPLLYPYQKEGRSSCYENVMSLLTLMP